MAGVGTPPVAVVAGSGMLIEALLDEHDQDLPFAAFPQLRACTVPGHAPRFMTGRCGRMPVILQLGRLHVYEGLTVAEVAATVDVLHHLGARTVIFTNAAGGLRPAMVPGDLMAVTGVAQWPYRPWAPAASHLQPSFTVQGCAHEGRYLWVHGPSYETPAEIRAMRALGHAAVGMSTAPEMARARALGIHAAAISCITNNCTLPQVLTHEHVIQTAAEAAETLCAVLRGYLGSIG
jgi:purine-nucleoside phosphorylase